MENYPVQVQTDSLGSKSDNSGKLIFLKSMTNSNLKERTVNWDTKGADRHKRFFYFH